MVGPREPEGLPRPDYGDRGSRRLDADGEPAEQEEEEPSAGYIEAAKTAPADNQTLAVVGPHEADLMSSLFSHIDKQWKFAEVILIIVISVILNFVTIIGNIMVLISFKMDRS